MPTREPRVDYRSDEPVTVQAPDGWFSCACGKNHHESDPPSCRWQAPIKEERP